MCRDQVTGVADAATIYAENFAELRRQQAERAYLHPLKLDSDGFIDAQADMEPNVVFDTTQKLRSYRLDVSAIIAGVDPDGSAHIYSIGSDNEYGEETAHETCHDGIGFCAIGIGSRHFESQYMLSQYNRFWNLSRAILLMYTAKRNAEVAPGVGPGTDMFYIDPRASVVLQPQYLNALDEHYQSHVQLRQQAWNHTVQGIDADQRLIATQSPQQTEQAATDHQATIPSAGQERQHDALSHESGQVNSTPPSTSESGQQKP
jgi:20S proteasome alpha/beta subunit